MLVALIHWRIRPEQEFVEAFRKHWKENNTIGNRSGLIAEFLSEDLPQDQYPYITWHLDPESIGNFKSFVTIGLWKENANFKEQVEKYFNDTKPLLGFEKYRRRRVIFNPVEWRVGEGTLPESDSEGVK